MISCSDFQEQEQILDYEEYIYQGWNAFETVNLDELSQYWKFQTDVTHRYNLHEYVNNKDLLDTKPDYYKGLVDFLNNKSFIP